MPSPCQRHSTWQVRVKSRATVVQVEVEVGRLSRCSPARAGKWKAPRRPLAAPGPELRPCPCQSSCHCIQVAAPGPPAGGGGPVRGVRVDPGHDSATAASLSAPAPGPLPCQCSPGPYHIGRTASAGIEKLVTGSPSPRDSEDVLGLVHRIGSFRSLSPTHAKKIRPFEQKKSDPSSRLRERKHHTINTM